MNNLFKKRTKQNLEKKNNRSSTSVCIEKKTDVVQDLIDVNQWLTAEKNI